MFSLKETAILLTMGVHNATTLFRRRTLLLLKASEYVWRRDSMKQEKQRSFMSSTVGNTFLFKCARGDFCVGYCKYSV